MADQPKAVLRLAGPEVPQETVEVTTKGIKIGRLAANDLPLKHQKLSRFHAEVHLTSSGELTIVDLGSSNGTIVGDTQLEAEKPYTLSLGDVIRLGPFTLTVEELTEPPKLDKTVAVEAPKKGDVPEVPATMAVSTEEIEKAVKAEAEKVKAEKEAADKDKSAKDTKSEEKQAEESATTVEEAPAEEEPDDEADAATIKPRQEILDEAAEAPTPPPEPIAKSKKEEEEPPATPEPVSSEATIVPQKTDPPVAAQYEEELPPAEPLMPEPDEDVLIQSFVPMGKVDTFKPPEPPELPPRVPFETSPNGHLPEHLEGVPRDRSNWLEYLPPIYAEDEFTRRFLLIFETIQTPIEWLLDHFYMMFMSDYAPPEWLQWFGRWADILVPEKIEEAKQRAIIAELGPLFLTRGTPNSLSRHLELVFGEKPDINEPKNKPSTFEVVLSLGKSGNTEQNQKIANRIIEAHRPAHTAYTLTIK